MEREERKEKRKVGNGREGNGSKGNGRKGMGRRGRNDKRVEVKVKVKLVQL